MLQIIHYDYVMELTKVVGVVTALGLFALSFLMYLHEKGVLAEVFDRARAFCRPRNFLLWPMLAAAVIYGGSKSNYLVPQVKSDGRFKQTTAAAETVGAIEYYCSTWNTSTNIPVAFGSGAYTNELTFLPNGFLYCYNLSQGVSAAQPAADNHLWVRASSEDRWIDTVQDSVFVTNGIYAAVMAHMTNGVAVTRYNQWFIGPEANLPAVIVLEEGGIFIDNVVITSGSVYIAFHPDDSRIPASATFTLQVRRTIDGVLFPWETVMTSSSSSPFYFEGYTVGEYREYRIICDVEVEDEEDEDE